MGMKCKVCGCTEKDPCQDYRGKACGWSDIEPNLCTACEDEADALVEWAMGSFRRNVGALMRVFKERLGAQRIPYVLTEKVKK